MKTSIFHCKGGLELIEKNYHRIDLHNKYKRIIRQIRNILGGGHAKFIYTPDEDVKVHEEGAIRLICKAFRSHESGLPKWLKNSSDACICIAIWVVIDFSTLNTNVKWLKY